MDDNKWDLTRMFKDETEFRDTILEVKNMLDEIVKYKGKILDSSENLNNVLDLDSKIDLLAERLYVYTHLGHYGDMSDKVFQEYKEEVIALYDLSSSVRTFITPELLSSNYEDVISLLGDDSKYKYSLEKTFRYKEHILSEKEEQILSDCSEIMRVPKTTFDALNNIDIIFGKAKDSNGEYFELTNSNYSVLLSSKDKTLRKNAFKKMYKYYKDHINTISSLYIGKVKSNSFISKTRKYKNILDMYLFDDKIDSKVYKNLIKITNKNTSFLKKYYKLKENKLGYKLHMYDTYVNTSNSLEKNISYEDAIKIVNDALKPLGSDYLEKFNYLLNNSVVDVYPADKKRSGAYQWGSYGILPYVSLNYENNMDSVSTFAHEMGHAMHTYYSDNNQDFLYASYPIFLAEIASTVNEVLLSNYLINNSKDKDEIIYYIVEFLDKFKATVYRQVMFAEFENVIHEKYENGISLTKDLLCETYLKLNKKHFSPSVVVDKDIQYEWARIPHFYSSFYVYKYATGFISALIIADKLINNEEGFKEKYISFLSSGCSDYPLELLNKLGIDITDEKVLEKAFLLFKEKVDLLEKYESGE